MSNPLGPVGTSQWQVARLPVAVAETGPATLGSAIVWTEGDNWFNATYRDRVISPGDYTGIALMILMDSGLASGGLSIVGYMDPARKRNHTLGPGPGSLLVDFDTVISSIPDVVNPGYGFPAGTYSPLDISGVDAAEVPAGTVLDPLSNLMLLNTLGFPHLMISIDQIGATPGNGMGVLWRGISKEGVI